MIKKNKKLERGLQYEEHTEAFRRTAHRGYYDDCDVRTGNGSN